jgi:hypothetical protein
MEGGFSIAVIVHNHAFTSGARGWSMKRPTFSLSITELTD